jgi:hypothetical protein
MKLVSTLAFAALLLAEQASGFVPAPAITKTHVTISVGGLNRRAAAIRQPASSKDTNKCTAMQRAAPARLSTALGAAPRQSEDDDSLAAPDRSNYRFIGFAKVWLAFVLYAFLLAPGHNPAAEAIDKVTIILAIVELLSKQFALRYA